MKKHFPRILTIVLIDGIITFINFFLLWIGFETMPRVTGQASNKTAEEMKTEVENYLFEVSSMFLIEILIGLVILFIVNYFLLKSNFNKPFKTTVIICVSYLIIIISIYFYFCHDLIQRNIN